MRSYKVSHHLSLFFDQGVGLSVLGLALSKEEGKIVDARLYHWALGLHWSGKIAKM